ncbi:MAG: WecB/TagA/CpsF family glycosyltransferase [Aeromicrobium sp.]|nr:WecB/TagA/CpsF family glycosyltransferase [Aeromicrobium sp.]
MRDEVFGVPLDLLTMDGTVVRCVELIEERRPVQHVVINAGKVVMMEDVAGLRDIIASCDLVSADGQSIVWAGRFLGLKVPERVAGIDLMHLLLDEAEERAWPVFFLGAKPEVLEACLTRLRSERPRLVVAGYRDGYFDDDAGVARLVGASGARLLLVGISSPRKETFLAQHLGEMGPVFAMGVGGSFDVVAGLTKRAPRWMQRAGLEWFYRLAQEPRRMWKRYLVGNARFAWLVVRERFRER